jgi:hypothetical protein
VSSTKIARPRPLLHPSRRVPGQQSDRPSDLLCPHAVVRTWWALASGGWWWSVVGSLGSRCIAVSRAGPCQPGCLHPHALVCRTWHRRRDQPSQHASFPMSMSVLLERETACSSRDCCLVQAGSAARSTPMPFCVCAQAGHQAQVNLDCVPADARGCARALLLEHPQKISTTRLLGTASYSASYSSRRAPASPRTRQRPRFCCILTIRPFRCPLLLQSRAGPPTHQAASLPLRISLPAPPGCALTV